jgi:hypothetical protein
MRTIAALLAALAHILRRHAQAAVARKTGPSKSPTGST